MEELIIERLGERQRKLKRMEELERPVRKPIMRTIGMSVLAIAACTILAVMLLPGNHAGEMGTYGWENEVELARGAGLEVETLLVEGDYSEALAKVDSAMECSRQEMDRLKQSEQDEETSYLLQAEEQQWEVLKTLRKKISEKMR